MPTRARASKIDKYSSSPEQEYMTHKGQKVPLGGVAEMLRHCDRQWYAYLERLINNPDEPNPLENYEDTELRQGLEKRGYIGLSQAQIRAMRSAYICGLQGGYSDKELYSTFYVPSN